MASVIVKLDAALLEKVGAASAAEFSTKLAAFVTESETIKSMADQTVQVSDLLKRIEALEARQDLTARVDALEKRDTTINAEEVKKIAGAEASRITAEALASIGTTPVKPAPAAPVAPGADELNAAGKYAEAYAADPKLRAEFDTAASYEAYMKAFNAGSIKTITK